MKTITPRRCEHCDKAFEKPYTESRLTYSKRRFCSQVCKKAAQIGRPTAKRGQKYRDNRKRIPCRICGKPTQYHGTELSDHYGMVHCGADECRAASSSLKRARQRRGYAKGLERGTVKPPQKTWRDVKVISDAEAMIEPWFTDRGWLAQYGFTTNRTDHPRWFRLDFAAPSKKLYVEIDGRVHHKPERIERDRRKDAIMGERGWRCLRVPAQLVSRDFNTATFHIETWLKSLK